MSTHLNISLLSRAQTLIKQLRPLDYLILIIFIVAIIVFYKFFVPEKVWIPVTFVSDEVPTTQAIMIKSGDYELDSTGQKIADVKKITSYNSAAADSQKKITLTAYLYVKKNNQSKEFEYKNKVVKPGSTVDLRLNSGILAAHVIDVNQNLDLKTETTEITVLFKEIWPWIADGVAENDVETDLQGDIIARVVSKEVTPAAVTVDTIQGIRAATVDPVKVDLTLKIKVETMLLGGDLIFRQDRRINIGESIWFVFDNTRISEGLITHIK